MDKNITDTFIQHIIKSQGPELPGYIRKKACMSLLDYLGCVYIGNIINKEAIDNLIKTSSVGENKILGTDHTADPGSAALINGMNAHVAELDDGHRMSTVHPGSVIISALLASCSDKKISGDLFLKGLVSGYEAAIRLGEAVQPSLKLRGGHSSGTCGTVGAAVAVATVMNFSREQLKTSIAAACTSASGLLEMIDDSSQLKQYNVGQAAMNGYVSAMVAKSGLIGPDDPIGGERGFLRFMADEYDEEKLTASDGTYKIEQIYVKPYASCRHSHPAIECVLKLAEERAIAFNDIDAIEIYTYKLAIPGHDRADVKSVGAAKMSTPFAVASAIINKNAGIDAFSKDMITDKKIIELAKKVHIHEDEKMTAASPGIRAAETTISFTDGDKFTKRVDFPLGEPENPMSENKIINKFESLAIAAGLSEDKIKSIIKATLSVDEDLTRWLKTI